MGFKLFRYKKTKPKVEFVRRKHALNQSDHTSSGFRRNRTISSINVGPSEGSSRSKAHDLLRRRRRMSAILLVVFLIVLLLGFIVYQFTARLVVDTSSGKSLSRPMDASKYEKIIDDYLAIHPIERLRFVMSQDGLNTFAASIAPEVAGIKQSPSGEVAKTRYSIEFRVPVAAWQIGDTRLYVDEHGVVFSDNYFNEPTLKIVDQSGVSPEQGSAVVSTRLLSFVGKLISLSGEGSYTISEVILPIGTTRQIDIKLKNVKPIVRLTIDRVVGEQVTDMIEALDYMQSKKISASYVDVRVSGKAVYR